jgi:hypothetical protein
MTRAFDVRHGTVEDILAMVDHQPAAKDAGRRTIPAWVSETNVQGCNPWRLPEVHR